MNNYYVGKLSAKIMFKKLKTLKEIDDYYAHDTELQNYSLVLLVDKNTQERIWAMYWYFQPKFVGIIIPSTYTLYSLRRRFVLNNGPQWKEPFKISIESNSITNEEQMPDEFRKILFEFWDGKPSWEYNELYINMNSVTRKITDDYDVYCTANPLDDNDILIINYFMKSFVSINNPIKDLILANEKISKDAKRTSLPQTSIRDIASFINPKHGIQEATRKGGRKRKHNRKSRKKYINN